jgi:CRP-like cAMP-binding protein
MKSEWTGVLMKSDLFRNVDPNDLAGTITCFQPTVLRYPKGETIVAAGDRLKGIGIVLQGSVEISKETYAGERVIMNKLGASGLFGEIAVFASDRTSPAYVTAKEDSTIMFITPEKLTGRCKKLCDQHQIITENLIGIISGKAAALNKKIDYLVIKSLRAKLCTFLYEIYLAKNKTEFKLAFDRNELADFLNIARPSLSREMGRLRDDGVIHFRGKAIQIVDPEKLKNCTFKL